MKFISKIEIGGRKYTQTQIVEKSFIAADAITLNGFSSAEELYNLLKINCLGSTFVIDQCLRELAIRFNERAAKESAAIYTDKDSKDAHVTNVVLMDNKLKIIADVRSFIATQNAENLETLPIFDSTINYIGCDPSAISIEGRHKENEDIDNVVMYKS
jgi:hypothetical protein